jgi:hypothetical protein
MYRPRPRTRGSVRTTRRVPDNDGCARLFVLDIAVRSTEIVVGAVRALRSGHRGHRNAGNTPLPLELHSLELSIGYRFPTEAPYLTALRLRFPPGQAAEALGRLVARPPYFLPRPCLSQFRPGFPSRGNETHGYPSETMSPKANLEACRYPSPKGCRGLRCGFATPEGLFNLCSRTDWAR